MKKIKLRLNQVFLYCISHYRESTYQNIKGYCKLEKIRLDMTLDVKRTGRIMHRFIGDSELMSSLIIR